MAKNFIFVDSNGDYEQSAGAYEQADFIVTSAGAGDSGKPVKLDAAGHIDATMINDADVDHNNVTNTHNLSTDIDHDGLTNTHNLTTDIDHDQLTNFAADEHIDWVVDDAKVIHIANYASALLLDGSRQATAKLRYNAAKSYSFDYEIIDKKYADDAIAAAITGSAAWKEVCLHDTQFADGATTNDGIKQAGIVYFTSQPIANDTVTVTIDGDTTQRTYTFVANQGAESVATDVSIESDAATAMARLVTRMNADGSRIMDAEYETAELASVNSGNGCVVLFLKDGTVIPAANNCGVYGTWGTQANVQVIDFADDKYESSTGANLPTTYSGNFGFGRQSTSLIANEAHSIRNTDQLAVWNNDANTWSKIASPGAYTASLGVEISTGNIQLDLLASGGLKLTSNEVGVEPNDFAGEGLVDDGSDNLKIDWSTAFNDSKAVKASDLASTSNGFGASIINIEDAGGYTSNADVESAIQELYEKVEEIAITFTSGTGGVTKGDLVYISGNDTVNKLNMTSANVAIGIAADTIGATNPVKVLMNGAVITGILSSATAGTKYWWNFDGASGGWQVGIPSDSGDYVWLGAVAKNAVDAYVNVEYIMKVA